MAAQKYPSANLLSHRSDGISQAGAIPLGIARKRRPIRPILPEREITTQHGNPSLCEGGGNRH
jgi:hypothetical protein